MQIEIRRHTFPRYLDILHLTTAAFRTGDWRMRTWSYANEAALWCVFLLLISGLWMALSRRQWRMTTLRTTHLSTAVITLPVAALFAFSALQMAHRRWIPAAGFFAWAGRLHRSSVTLSGIIGVATLLVVATGVLLWWTLRRDRALGMMLAAGAAILTLSLIIAMRAS